MGGDGHQVVDVVVHEHAGRGRPAQQGARFDDVEPPTEVVEDRAVVGAEQAAQAREPVEAEDDGALAGAPEVAVPQRVPERVPVVVVADVDPLGRADRAHLGERLDRDEPAGRPHGGPAGAQRLRGGARAGTDKGDRERFAAGRDLDAP